eukprot:3850365-Pleurochrysis_carterae.AAC.3
MMTFRHSAVHLCAVDRVEGQSSAMLHLCNPRGWNLGINPESVKHEHCQRISPTNAYIQCTGS